MVNMKATSFIKRLTIEPGVQTELHATQADKERVNKSEI